MCGPCPKVFLCLRFDEMRHNISYEFYLKDTLKTYRMFVKSINSALLFICLYAMKMRKGLYKTSEKSSMPVVL